MSDEKKKINDAIDGDEGLVNTHRKTTQHIHFLVNETSSLKDKILEKSADRDLATKQQQAYIVNMYAVGDAHALAAEKHKKDVTGMATVATDLTQARLIDGEAVDPYYTHGHETLGKVHELMTEAEANEAAMKSALEMIKVLVAEKETRETFIASLLKKGGEDYGHHLVRGGSAEAHQSAIEKLHVAVREAARVLRE